MALPLPGKPTGFYDEKTGTITPTKRAAVERISPEGKIQSYKLPARTVTKKKPWETETITEAPLVETGEEKAAQIAAKKKPKIAESTIKDLSNLKETITAMQGIKNEFTNKGYETGLNLLMQPPDIIQRRTGSEFPGIEKPGKYTAGELANFMRKVDTTFHKLVRKPITGAQAATNELRMLRTLFPKQTDTRETFMLGTDETIYGARKAYNTALKELRDAGYDTGKLMQFPESLTVNPREKKTTKPQKGKVIVEW